MVAKKNTARSYSEEWDYVNPSGVHAHVARRTGTSTFDVTFSHTGKLKLVNGEYELQSDSKYIPHAIVDRVIADDIVAAQREA
ncbi:hypothetical protein [Alloscardovia criceti]|uniref:hypothetical protein n=1 Tax=Alloscardovia criceti TaxID=356828 RepID=UPI00035E3BC2|nr:hypothetical protein [Alloscardovia criceti]